MVMGLRNATRATTLAVQGPASLCSLNLHEWMSESSSSDVEDSSLLLASSAQ